MPSGFFWGGFGQGLRDLGQALDQRERLKLQKQEHDLRSKMLKLQVDKFESDLLEKTRQQKATDELAGMLTGGVQEPTVIGGPVQGPVTETGQGPAEPPPLTSRPANQQEIMGALLKADRASVVKQMAENMLTPKKQTHIPGGSYIPDPSAPGGYRLLPKGPGEEKPRLSAEQLQSIYGMDPTQAERISALPGDVQEKTIDNLRSQTGQESAERRFQESQANIASRFAEGQAGLAARFAEGEQRREAAEARRLEQTNKRIEGSLRAEHIKQSKNFIEVRQNYNRLKSASGNTAMADHALIFSYLKVLDPGSTVREGEFATVENARGIPDNLRNLYNKALKGTRLTASQRSQIIDQGKRQYDASLRTQESIDQQYRQLAIAQGLDPNRVVLDYTLPSDEPSKVAYPSSGQSGTGPAAQRQFKELPPPGQLKGKTLRDPATGQRLTSDGMKWIPQPAQPAGGEY
jgi:hypothetical protein